MRILLLNRSRGIVGGVETYLSALCPLLLSAGHELWFGYENEALPGNEIVGGKSASLCQISKPAHLRAFIKCANAGLVFLHGLDSVDLEETAFSEAPTLQFLHNYQGACISGTKRHAFPEVVTCKRPLGPGCLAYYFPRRCGGLNPLTASKMYLEQRRRQQGLRCAAGVVVASAFMKAEAIKNGVDGAKLFVAPYFPTTQVRDQEAPVRRFPTGELLFVGRVTRLKGLEVLVEAIPLVEREMGKRLTLTVAGDGEDAERVGRTAKRRGVRLEFRSWVDAKERETLMRRADLLVVPSLWPEPFGIVGIEAGALGLPAVAFAQGGIPDWLLPGISGEVSVSGPNIRGLSDALVRALGVPEHYQNLRLGAWANSARFSAEAHLNVLHAAFSAASASPGKSRSL
jgi:glycosyltransferase involved in cell wall biosynthesis